jgi:hypothetical protein
MDLKFPPQIRTSLWLSEISSIKSVTFPLGNRLQPYVSRFLVVTAVAPVLSELRIKLAV